jgi:hypothetical protein
MDDPTLLSWIERGQNIAALLVAAGVAGEFILGFMAGPPRRRIEAAKESEIVRLTNESANSQLQIAQANERAAHAEATAKGFDAQIAASDAKAKSAEATAKQFEAQIAEANKTAAAAKLDLAEFKEPRGFHSDKEIQGVIDKCKPFPKTPFIPLVNPDPEAVRLLGVIDDILVSSCDWTPQSDDVFGFAIPLPRGTARVIWAVTGISVLFSPQYPELERPAKALADGLLAVGIKAKVEANNTATKNAVYLVVGQKP